MSWYMGDLGFRDFELVNLALLARKAWRILENMKSLSAWILKVVYFPKCTILEAQVGIIHLTYGAQLLKAEISWNKGLVRCIGNGLSTEIWSTNWIPWPEMMRPIVSRVANPPNDFGNKMVKGGLTRWKGGIFKQIGGWESLGEVVEKICPSKTKSFYLETCSTVFANGGCLDP